MNGKFEFTGEVKVAFGITFNRLRAKVSFGTVAAGEVGGWVEKETNVEVYGDAWVSGNAQIKSHTDWLLLGPAKSSGRFTTAYLDSKIGVRVSCGCFSGGVQDFSFQIEETHAGNLPHLQQYRLFCQLIAFNFGVEPACT